MNFELFYREQLVLLGLLAMANEFVIFLKKKKNAFFTTNAHSVI